MFLNARRIIRLREFAVFVLDERLFFAVGAATTPLPLKGLASIRRLGLSLQQSLLQRHFQVEVSFRFGSKRIDTGNYTAPY